MGAYGRDVEHLLESVWLAEEDGRTTRLEELKQSVRGGWKPEAWDTAQRESLAVVDRGAVRLSPDGQRHAVLVVRRHRLAERLLRDLLDVGTDHIHTSACGFEHCLNEEVTTSICTLLGHPTTCPHGRTIPPGDCCTEARKTLGPLFMPLADLPVGREAKVMYVTGQHGRLERLSAIGLLPGARIKLHQRRPSYVIQVRETEIAIDEEIARDIHIRPL